MTAVRPLADRLVATVHNAGARARDARVHLAIDDRPAGRRDRAARPESVRRGDIRRRAARRGRDGHGRRCRRHPGRQRPLRGARRHEPAVGAGRQRDGRSRPRRVLRAARARRRRRRRRGVSGDGRRRGAAVGLERGPAGVACGGRPAVDARARAARARAAGGVRAQRRRHARRGRRRRRRQHRRRRARGGIDAARRHRHRDAGRSRARWRRPTCGIRCFSRLPGTRRRSAS